MTDDCKPPAEPVQDYFVIVMWPLVVPIVATLDVQGPGAEAHHARCARAKAAVRGPAFEDGRPSPFEEHILNFGTNKQTLNSTCGQVHVPELPHSLVYSVQSRVDNEPSGFSVVGTAPDAASALRTRA